VPHAVRCPNCQAPLAVDPKQPVLKCQYCGYDVKQTVAYQPVPRPQPPGPQVVQISDQGRKMIKIIIWVTVVMTVLPGVIVLIVFLSAMQTGSKVVSQINSSRTRSTTYTTKSAIEEQVKRAFGLGAGGLNRPDEPTDPEDALQKKLEVYLSCVNTESGAVHDSRARYLGWLTDAEKGPTCKESCISWGISSINPGSGSTSCADRVEAAKALGPSRPDLEQMGAAFVASVRELAPLINEANRHYDQKDYQDDGCAKAKELHGKLMPAFARFEKADLALRATLGRDWPALQERQLPRLEKSAPQAPRTAFLKLGIAMRRVLQAALAVNSQATVDLTALRGAIKELDDASRSVEQRCAGISPLDHWHTSCVFAKSSTESHLRAAKELARTRAKATPRRHPLLGYRERGAGTIDDLIDQHNRLLRWVPAAGLDQRPPAYDTCSH
jgi:hypothetical protein